MVAAQEMNILNLTRSLLFCLETDGNKQTNKQKDLSFSWNGNDVGYVSAQSEWQRAELFLALLYLVSALATVLHVLGDRFLVLLSVLPLLLLACSAHLGAAFQWLDVALNKCFLLGSLSLHRLHVAQLRVLLHHFAFLRLLSKEQKRGKGPFYCWSSRVEGK